MPSASITTTVFICHHGGVFQQLRRQDCPRDLRGGAGREVRLNGGGGAAGAGEGEGEAQGGADQEEVQGRDGGD